MPAPTAAATAPVARAGPFAFLAALLAALPVSGERPLELAERPAELRERLGPELDEPRVRDLLAPPDLLAAGLEALLARVVLRCFDADEPLRRALLEPFDFELEALPDLDAARLLDDEELLAAVRALPLAPPEERRDFFGDEPLVLARPVIRLPVAVSSAST